MKRFAVILLVAVALCAAYSVGVEAGASKVDLALLQEAMTAGVSVRGWNSTTYATYKGQMAVAYSNLRVAQEIKAASLRIEKAIR